MYRKKKQTGPGPEEVGKIPQSGVVKPYLLFTYLLFRIYSFLICYFVVAFLYFLIRILIMKSKTQVYFNLHKKMLSVRVNGKVVAHAPAIVLDNPTFHVSEAGRQRVLKSRRKNVHAWVSGDWNGWLHTGIYAAIGSVIREESGAKTLLSFLDHIIRDSVEVTYNPYKFSTFVLAKDGSPIKNARYAVIHGKKIYAQL